MTSFAHPGAVTSCVRSKGWGQTVPTDWLICQLTPSCVTPVPLDCKFYRYFCPKTPFLGQFLLDFFLTERGVPPSPLNGKSVVENLTEKS